MVRLTSTPLLLLVALLCSVFPSQPALGQVTWPLTGQGLWPDSFGKVVVTVDAHLDRLLEINQNAQSWRAIHRMHLSWIDPRAEDAILTASKAWYNSSTFGSAGCSLTCDASMSYEAGCCSSIWLPHIDLPNLLEYDYQVAPPRWRIWVEPIVLSNGTSSSKVHWTVRLDGTWFSPFDFRAWPLEHQHLVMEMQPSAVLSNKVQLVLGNLGQLSNTPHTKGVDLAGWWINKVTPRMFNTSACFHRSNTTSWVIDVDPAASSYGSSSNNSDNSNSMVQLRSLSPGDLTTSLSNTTVVTSVQGEACGDIGNPEGISQYGAYVLVIDSMVKRDKTFYVLIFIVPLIIVTFMVFVIYAMERQNLEARMGVVVTLVLALSALQFMYDFPPASYLNVVQQLTLTSYVLFGIIAVECIITSSISRIHERKRTYEAVLIAAGLKTLEFSKTSLTTTNSRPGSEAALDFTLDDDKSRTVGLSNPPTSGLFFGSSPPTKASDPFPFKTAVPHAVAEVAALCHAPAERMSPIPEADSQRSGNQSAGSSMKPPSVGRAYVEVEVHGPEEPYSEQSSGRKGQAVCEGMELLALFQKKSLEGSEQASVPAPDWTLKVPPSAPAAQPGKMTQIKQGFGRGRRSVEHMLSNVHGKTRALRSKMSMDEAFAQLLARRVDMVSFWTLMVSYIIVISTLLAVSSDVGDHKLMLAGATAPGNMR